MELRREQARAEGEELRIRWEPVPLARIPRHLRRAVRVAEDAAFYGHAGVDWHEVRASLREWWSEDERLRGASTITMQLARNLYLSPERSLLRKVREVLLALRLEDGLTKARILELYLNVVELGPGVFGVEAASRHYWDASVAGLGRDRAAELAAALPAPLVDNPATRTRRFLWRADLIRRRAFGGAPATSADSAAADTAPGVGAPADTGRPLLPSPDTAGPDGAGPGLPVPDSAAPAQPSGTGSAPGGTASSGGRKNGSHFSRGDGSVRRLTTTRRVMEISTPGITM